MVANKRNMEYRNRSFGGKVVTKQWKKKKNLKTYNNIDLVKLLFEEGITVQYQYEKCNLY